MSQKCFFVTKVFILSDKKVMMVASMYSAVKEGKIWGWILRATGSHYQRVGAGEWENQSCCSRRRLCLL